MKVRQEAQVGRYGSVDYLTTQDGKLIKGGESKDYLIELGAKRTLPGFEDAIAGMSVGQTKEFDLDAPASATMSRLGWQARPLQGNFECLETT